MPEGRFVLSGRLWGWRSFAEGGCCCGCGCGLSRVGFRVGGCVMKRILMGRLGAFVFFSRGAGDVDSTANVSLSRKIVVLV